MLISVNLVMSALVFFLLKFCFKKKIQKRFEKENIYQVLSKSSNTSPYKTATMIRLLKLPYAYKNFISSTISLGFRHFYIPAIFHIIISTIIDVNIGKSLKNLNDLENYSITKDFKMYYAIIYYLVSILFTFVAFTAFGIELKESFEEKKNYNLEKVNSVSTIDLSLSDGEEKNSL